MERRKFTAVLLVATLLSCSDDANLSLSSHDDDDWSTLRSRLNVTIIDSSNVEQTMTPKDIALGFIDECQEESTFSVCSQVPEADVYGGLNTGVDCDHGVCMAQLRLCAAHLLMEVATNVDPNYAIASTRIPPQSMATRAGLAEEAIVLAREAIIGSIETMRSPVGFSSTMLCTAEDIADSSNIADATNGEVLGVSLEEGYQVLREAARLAVRANVAVSEESYGTETSLRRATTRAYRAPVLSRGHVAELLFGTPQFANPPSADAPALPAANAIKLVGDRARPSPTVRIAIEAIRDAAPSRTQLLAGTDIDDFVAGTGGSVRQRLADLYDTELPTTPDAFLAHLGVSRSDFLEARAVLRDEVTIFQRHEEIELPQPPMPGGRSLTYTRYAETALAPPSMPTELWIGAANVASGHNLDDYSLSTFGGANALTPAHARKSVAAALDYAISGAIQLSTMTAQSPLPESTINSFAGLFGERERVSRLEFDSAGKSAVLRVLGASPGEMLAVRGLNGVRCAMTGLVEGLPCDLADYRLSSSWSQVSVPVGMGFPGGTAAQVSVTWTGDDGEELVGLLRRQDPEREAVSGNFKPIIDLPLFAGPSTFVNGSISLVPELADWVKDLIVPDGSDDAPSRPPVFECDGGGEAPLLPLQNELTDDGPVWRSYLNRARVAADEADELGRQLIEAGLELDRTSQQALDSLENECGAAIDADWLAFGEVNGATGERARVDGTCSMPTDCSDGYTCTAGRCVINPVQALLASPEAEDDANLSRLRACIGDEGRIPLVSLGSRTVCVVRDGSNENILCPADAGVECPFFLDTTTEPTCEDVSVPGFSVVTAVPLGIFEAVEGSNDSGGPSARQEVCRAIRALRPGSSVSAGDQLGFGLQLASGREFYPENARLVASNIRAEALPGTHVRLMLGSKTWMINTGKLSTVNAGSWPCSGAPTASSCDGDGGFLCTTAAANACASDDLRRPIVERTLRAVLAARVITGASIQGITLPVVGGNFWNRCGPLGDRTDGSRSIYTSTCSNVAEDGRDGPDDAEYVYAIPQEGEPVWLSPTGDRWNNVAFVTPTLNATSATIAQSSCYANGLQAFSPGRLCTEPAIVDALFYGDPWATFAQWANPENWRVDGDGSNSTYEWDDDDSYARRDIEPAFPYHHVTYESVRDALELICEAGVDPDSASIEAVCGAPPEFGETVSTADLERVAIYMDCAAQAVEQLGEQMLFANVPGIVVDAVLDPTGIGAYPLVGGTLGNEVTTVRDDIRSIPRLRRSVATEISLFGSATTQFKEHIIQYGLEDQLQRLSLASQLASQATSCAVASSSAGSVNGVLGGGVGAAAATCTNAAIQSVIAIQSFRTENELDASEQRSRASDFMEVFISAAERMQSKIDDLLETQERINGGLIRIEQAQRRARQGLSTAVMADSDASGRVYRANTVMRRRYNTLSDRYQRAHRYAQQMTVMARIAVEQQLGMRLDEIDRPLSIGDQPSSWVNTICQSSGIDYAAIRDASDETVTSYAGQFVGDYVRRLEAVIESYRVDFPFSDGVDTAVISMRDELHGVRSSRGCYLESPFNLARSTTAIRVGIDPAEDPESADTWFPTGCAELTNPNASGPQVNCVAATPLGENPLAATLTRPVGPAAWRLVWGPVDELGSSTPTAGTDPDLASVRPSTRLIQSVTLPAGRQYQASWYARPAPVLDASEEPTMVDYWGPEPADAMEVWDTTGAALTGAAACSTPDAAGWQRCWSFFDVGMAAEPQTVSFGFAPRTVLVGMVAEVPAQAVDVARVQIEDVTDRVFASTSISEQPPRVYQDPDAEVGLCEDTDGGIFRTTKWRRHCDFTCPAGAPSCAREVAVPKCFWESSFSIALADIEQQRIIHSGGFARGNYNYRFESLGVNFIGTNVRDCSEAGLPSTCYANGTVPYSIYHRGPYRVRNHLGDDSYEAPLFEGRIEHARGLAAERYLTNPLSGADRGLIEPFYQRQLVGRPLNGTYYVRIWDEPGVRFENIEDVQLVLNYRYWTRLD